jgi:hypothetical protein
MDGSRDPSQVNDSEYANLADSIMHRQAALSRKVAAVFLIILLGLPLVNLRYPEQANAPVAGFTLTWLFLGVLFYPITWVLSWYFIRESDRIEAKSSEWEHMLPTHSLGPRGEDEA